MTVNISGALSSYKKALEANKSVINTVGENYNQGKASDFSTILGRLNDSDDVIPINKFNKEPPKSDGMLSNFFGKLRNVVGKSEQVSNDAMHHKASLSDVATAVAEADMALQTITALRDKVIAAYQDIMKMPI